MARKPPGFSQPAAPRVAVAVRELLKVQRRLTMLNAERAMLNRIIIDGGGGAAHGYRACIRHTHASCEMRRVTVKARAFVQLVPYKGTAQ